MQALIKYPRRTLLAVLFFAGLALGMFATMAPDESKLAADHCSQGCQNCDAADSEHLSQAYNGKIASKYDSQALQQPLHRPMRKCGFSSFTVKRMRDIIQGGQQVQVRRERQFQVNSPSERFRIHFDIGGDDGVDASDVNQNSIPDYIDSVAYYFDMAWQIEIDEIGFLPPPSDGNEGGSSAYDIYIEDRGDEGIYGLTFPERNIGNGGSLGRFTTYIVVDNNFSALDSTGDGFARRRSYFETGIRALRVTAAHEFHHAIQLGAYGNIQNDCSIHELSATWAEIRVHPDVYDSEQFIPNLMRNLEQLNFGNDDCEIGYNYGIFTQMLQERHSDAAMLETWKAVRQLTSGYDALDQGLQELGSDLPSEFCEFSNWLYYTNYRNRGKELQRASEYPLVSFNAVETYSEPSISLNGELKSFEQRFVRLLFPGEKNATPDTVDIALVNVDMRSAGENSGTTIDYSIVCTSAPQGNSEPVGNTGYYLDVESSRPAEFCHTVYINTGVITSTPETPFPSPFIADQDERLFFPLDPNINVSVQSANLTVYDNSMKVLFSGRAELAVENDYRVVAWDARTDLGATLSSGVYIYSLEYLDEVSVGKFLVKASQ